jgi:hypothetical protein
LVLPTAWIDNSKPSSAPKELNESGAIEMNGRFPMLPIRIFGEPSVVRRALVGPSSFLGNPIGGMFMLHRGTLSRM